MIINTTNKTIQIENETLGEVVAQLQRMLPDSWKEYKLYNPVQITVTDGTKDVPFFREIPYVPYTPSTDPYHVPWRITSDGSFTVTPCVTYGDPSKFGTLHKTVSGDLMSAILAKSADLSKNS